MSELSKETVPEFYLTSFFFPINAISLHRYRSQSSLWNFRFDRRHRDFLYEHPFFHMNNLLSKDVLKKVFNYNVQT